MLSKEGCCQGEPELAVLGWLDRWTVKQDQRTYHQAELAPGSSLSQGQQEILTKHQLVLLFGEPTPNNRKPLLRRICFHIVGGAGTVAGVLPFPELLSVDWDSLFTRFFPLRAS